MNEIDLPSQPPTGLPPLSEWLVEQMRLTAFADPQTPIDYSSWWVDVLGEPPDSQLTEPKLGKHREEASLGEGTLRLEIQEVPSKRVNWVLAAGEREPQIDGFANVGHLPEVLDEFRGLMYRWFDIETRPAIKRLAFGAGLLYPVESFEAGYRQLDAFLPYVQMDPEGSSDFQYWINRRRDSRTEIPELRINRLSRWLVGKYTPMTLQIDSEGLEYTEMESHFACRLLLDINTIAEYREELSGELIPEIWQELIDLGLEIVREGDIP